MITTNKTWPQFATNIATDSDPYLHSPAAMERYVKHMADYIVKVRVPHGKFRALNECELIDFVSAESAKRYALAEERYIEACAKVGKQAGSGTLVAFTIFRKAAEKEKAPIFASKMYDAHRAGFAPVAAACYRSSIAIAVQTLMHKYGVKREQISIIWGGDDVYGAAKLDKATIVGYIRKMALGETLPRSIMRVLEHQLTLDADTDEDFSGMELGKQSRKQRQEEIDRFQSGRSQYCFYTFAAGGVGLSLHHTDKTPWGKPVDLKPRRTFVTPTYSAQDFVQGLCRAHRTIFSLSDTRQTVLFFRNTIEEHVMARVSLKLRCLSKVVTQRESWQDAIYKAALDKETFERDMQKDETEIKNMLESGANSAEDQQQDIENIDEDESEE